MYFISDAFDLPVSMRNGSWTFECTIFQNGVETYAVLKKGWERGIPLVRIASLCTFGQLLNSAKCNCGPQLWDAIERVSSEGGIIAIAMHQDGRGVRLVDHANAYALQQEGLDTVESYEKLGLQVDSRDYCGIAMILKNWYKLEEVKLITNNPKKIEALENVGIRVKAMNSLVAADKLNRWRARQFAAAADKMGHILPKSYKRRVRKLTGGSL